MMEETKTNTKQSVEKQQVMDKKKRNSLLVGAGLILLIACIFGYRFLQAPSLAKETFTFAYGEAIPTNSSAYFHHGMQYEDVEFDPSLFTMQELGEYQVRVEYYEKEYVLPIEIRDETPPEILFSKEDVIHVLAIKEEVQTAPIFTIEDLSSYTYEMTPSAKELQNGVQNICVNAIDEYDNQAEKCADINLQINTYTLHADVSANSIEELIQTFIKEKRLTKANFGFFYYSPTDKEEYIYNEDTLFNAASTIKVPLNMLYYDRLAQKEISETASYVLTAADIEEGDGETILKYKVKQAVPLTFLQEQSIVNSDNTATNMLIRGLKGFHTFRKLLCTYDEQTYPSRFYTENVVNMQYMLSVLKQLYEHQDTYQVLIENMKHASEGLYLQKSTKDFEIAQKYGLYDTNLHAIGIVYTPNPYIVGIYTNNVINGEDIIVELNEWLLAYQLQKL